MNVSRSEANRSALRERQFAPGDQDAVSLGVRMFEADVVHQGQR
jgi:hypothetical protein